MIDKAWIESRAASIRGKAADEEAARILRRGRRAPASSIQVRPSRTTVLPASVLKPERGPAPRPASDEIPRGKGIRLLRAATPVASKEASGVAGKPARSPAAKLASGYQPAVLKVISYGHGVTRATAIGQYVQRGETALETHEGKRLATQEAVVQEMKVWARDFDKRRPSDDAATFRLSVEGEGRRERLVAAVEAGFAGHRFAYRFAINDGGAAEMQIVASMAGQTTVRGENGDEKVAERFHLSRTSSKEPSFTPPTRDMIASRVANALEVPAASVRVTPDGAPGHGKAGVVYQLARLAARGEVTGQDNAPMRTEEQVRATAEAWNRSLNSFAPRDVMHMILSAKAGADKEALMRAARGFLHERFPDNKFAFALHDDKEADGHVHVHAVVAVKGDNGQRLRPGPRDLRAWRHTYAEHAEAQGLKIVAVSAAQRASSQSYGSRDKAIIAIAERPRADREAQDRAYAETNPQLAEKARRRIERAGENPIRLPTTARQLHQTAESLDDWRDVQANQPHNPIANHFVDRLTRAQASGRVLVTLQDYGKGRAMADASAAEMRENLRDLNAAVSDAADALQGSARTEFLRRTGETMEILAIRTDVKAKLESGRSEISEEEATQLAGPHADALIARARQIQAAETIEAQTADDFRDRAIEQEVRDERSGAADPASLAQVADDRRTVRAAESIAQRERSEAVAAAEAVRELAAHPQQPLGPEVVQGARLEELRRDQERSTTINTAPSDDEEAQSEKPASQRM